MSIKTNLSEKNLKLKIRETFKEVVDKKYYSEAKLLPIINNHMSKTANLMDSYFNKKITKEKVFEYINSLINVFENYPVTDFAEGFKKMFKGVRETFGEISKKFEEKGEIPLLEDCISRKIIIPKGYNPNYLLCLNNENIENTINLIKKDYEKFFEEFCNPKEILVYPIAATQVEKIIHPSCVAIYCKEKPL